jgi:hypothetical protein
MNYRFRYRDGQKIEDGKSYYPDTLSLYVDRHMAFELIQVLASRLQSTDDIAFEVPLTFSGEMTRMEDE